MSNNESNNSGNKPGIIKDPSDLFFKISLPTLLAGLLITIVVVLLSGLSGVSVLVVSALSTLVFLILLDEISHRRRPTQ